MYDQEIINAVKQNNPSEVKVWLAKGANVNTRDQQGNLLIELAVYFQCQEIFEYLVNSNVDLKICDVKKLIAWEHQLSRSNLLLRQLIILRAHSQKYIEAQVSEDIAIICNKLITSLLYESSRHDWGGEKPMELRIQIEYLAPWFIGKTKKDYIEYIQEKETQNNTFYGSYLSDDSDSDEEREFSKKDESTKNTYSQYAEMHRQRAQVENIFYKKKTGDFKKGDLRTFTHASAIFDLDVRTTIHHGNYVDKNKVKRDLDHLNILLKRGDSISEALTFLQSQDPSFTRFFVAQYRGITHLTTRWNQSSRKAHRKDQAEINKPQYSASIMVAAGVDIFRSYATATHRQDEIVDPAAAKPLKAKAELLREILLTLREPRPYSYAGYTYANLAYLLQAVYTQDYDGFHRLIKTDPLLSCLLLNDYNPFLSTGDTPYHAEKYAYGIKPYKGHEGERLRPRWRRDGKAERPYSGVVYASLHPLSDFTQDGPLHLISLNRAAEIKLKKELEIISERESCFPAFLPEGRVFFKQIAKYPSFRGPYKQIYFYKYGLNENFYYKLQHKLQSARPHTPEMKAFKKLLGEWLCSYYEVILIDKARQEAEQRCGVLIYRDINGAFSLKPPIDSVNRNHTQMTEEVKTPIKNKQQRRSSLSPCASPVIQPIYDESSVEEVIDSLANLAMHDTSILIGGNSDISPAFSLLINAVREKRHLALAHYLKIPIFQQEINKTLNTSRLINAGLLHLAVLAKSPDAVRLLLQVPEINVNLTVDETTENQRYKNIFYEDLTPLHLAIMEDQTEIVSLLCTHPQIKLNSYAAYVVNKYILEHGDLLFEGNITADENGERKLLPGEPGYDPDFLGMGWVSRKAWPIIRTPNISLLHMAVERDSIDMIKILLSQKHPFMEMFFACKTLLSLHSCKNKYVIATQLINAGIISSEITVLVLSNIDFGLRNYIQNCSTPKKPANVADDVFDYLCTLKKKNITLLTYAESNQYIPRQTYFGENDSGCTREIAYALFSWFDTDNLKKSSKVCKAWKKLSNDVSSDRRFKSFYKEEKDEIIELEKSLNDKLKI